MDSNKNYVTQRFIGALLLSLILCACDTGFKQDNACSSNSDASEKAEHTLALYHSVEGVYEVTLQRPSNGSSSPVEIRLVALMDSIGSDSCGRPVPKATLVGQFRRNDFPSWRDYENYAVVFNESSRELTMVYRRAGGGGGDSNGGQGSGEDNTPRVIQTVSGTIDNQFNFRGQLTGPDGYEGTLSGRQTLKQAGSDPDGYASELRERLLRVFAPYVGDYEGRFTRSSIPEFNNFLVRFSVFIDTNGPALKVSVSFPEKTGVNPRLADVMEFRPDTGYIRFHAAPSNIPGRVPGSGQVSAAGHFRRNRLEIVDASDHRGSWGSAVATKKR